MEMRPVDLIKHNKAKNDFYLKMKAIHPNIIHGDYIRSNTKVGCECLICGYKWKSAPDNLLRKNSPRGCPKCAKNVAPTSEEIKEKLIKKFPNIIILSDNIKLRENMLYEFGDGIIYQNKPASMLKDEFSNYLRYWTQDIYDKELSKANPNVVRVSDFTYMGEKITHYCKTHDTYFEIDPNHSLRGQGCFKCKIQKIGDTHRKPEADYIKLLSKEVKNIELVGEYSGYQKPARHKCVVCGHEWYATPTTIIKNQYCPHCKLSKGERKIAFILDELKINYEHQHRIDDCKNIRTLPFDFAIFDINNQLSFLIEYQGKQHYYLSQFGNISIEQAQKNLEECQMRDAIKLNYCKNNNIDLLVIPYTDYNSLDDVISNKLYEKHLITALERR